MLAPECDSRKDLVKFLMQRSNTQIETHISNVFLTGDFVYKIKKPLNYGFLDFSTLEKRRIACEREVKLNSRFAPEIYLGVVPITKSCGRFAIGGSGTVVEYAVKMKQFDNQQLFSELLKQGKLGAAEIVALTREIAAFHAQAELKPGAWNFETVKRLVLENTTALREHGEKLRALSEQALAKCSGIIETRSCTHVKALHGDLHLKNVVLLNGKPTMFDGIEFNDEYSNIDPWADVAFLIMDLISAGRKDLATIALNTYLDLTDDFAGLELLPLYLSYRAAVRAKVAGLRAQDAGRTAADDPDCIRYRELAHRLLCSKQARVIAIGGFSGSGKSTLASGIVPIIGAVHLRTDLTRRHIFGLIDGQQAPQEVYTKENIDLVYAEVLKRARHVILAGFPVVFDAVYGDEHTRAALEEFAKKLGVNFTGIWCEVPRDLAVSRIRQRAAAKSDLSDATEAVLDSQLARGTGTLSWTRFDTSVEQEIALANCLKKFQFGPE